MQWPQAYSEEKRGTGAWNKQAAGEENLVQGRAPARTRKGGTASTGSRFRPRYWERLRKNWAKVSTSGFELMEMSLISVASSPEKETTEELILELHTQRTLFKQWLTTSQGLLKYSVWPSAWRRQRYRFTKIPHSRCIAHITINGHLLTYLSSVISNDAMITKDLEPPSRQSQQLFWSPPAQNVAEPPTSLNDQSQSYVAVVISTLLYAVETWVLCRKHIQLLKRFHQR